MDDDRIQIIGSVMSGRGIASRMLAHEICDFRRVLRQDLVPGTLNLITSRPVLFNEATALSVSNGRRLLWQAVLSGHEVWLYRWPHAPLHVAELLAPFHLRARFGLRDEDRVQLMVGREDVLPLSRQRRLAWALIWAGRGRWSYRRDSYYRRTRQLAIDLGATQQPAQLGMIRATLRFLRRGFR
ncbi:MAG: hypothetical protein AAF577_04450 [Pseudomonadota bacterium]